MHKRKKSYISSLILLGTTFTVAVVLFLPLETSQYYPQVLGASTDNPTLLSQANAQNSWWGELLKNVAATPTPTPLPTPTPNLHPGLQYAPTEPKDFPKLQYQVITPAPVYNPFVTFLVNPIISINTFLISFFSSLFNR